MVKKILLFLFFIVSISSYSQSSQVLIETTLTKYSNDVKTNTYSLTLTPTGGSSKSYAYTINNNDDNETYFYDIIQLNQSNYPINYFISAFNRVKPAILDGPECSQNFSGKFTPEQSPSPSACHGTSSFLCLDLPTPSAPVGSCETITIKKYVNLTNASYSWQYKKSADADWSYFNYGEGYDINGLSFIPKNIPQLSNYSGNLLIRFAVITENFKTGKVNNYFSNIAIYNITDCSPLYVGGDPPVTAAKCHDSSTGTVTLKFKSELVNDDVFLFNLFFNDENGEFIQHKFVKKNELSNNTFVWENLKPATYFIKYQAQRSTDTNTSVGLSVAKIPSFTIDNVDPLTFNLQIVKPSCDVDQIQISAKGGTEPYYYYFDYEGANKKHEFKSPFTIPDNKSNGNYKITVIDSQNCIEK